MRAIRRRLSGEDGSALVVSLMMIFIMTVLGLALFDLGVIENRLTTADEADVRALEIANAGLERGYRFLTNYIVNVNPDSLTNAALSDIFYLPELTITNASFLGGGSYGIEFMMITPATANGVPFGQPCISSGGVLPKCKDLLFIRTRGGTFANLLIGTLTPGQSPSATYGRVRAVQALVRAESLSPFAYAVTAETQGPNQIRGLIAGSVNLLACSTCNPFGFDGSGLGMRNHYNDISADAISMSRITPLQDVCPTGSTCATRMFSMGATLKIALPTTSPAVVTAGSLGENTNPGPYTHDGSTFVGKGTLDSVFIADGCSTTACTDNFTLSGGAAVNVTDGNINKPYPRRPPRSFPRLIDPVTVGPTSYQHYACLAGCGTETQFITSNATTAGHAGGGWTLTPGCAAVPCPGSPVVAGTIATAFSGASACDGACPALGAAFAGNDFENTVAFVHDFRYVNGAGVSREGRICWTGPSGAPPRTFRFATSAANGLSNPLKTPLLLNTTPLALQTGVNCNVDAVFGVAIATTAAPLLVYIDGGSATGRGFWLGNSGGAVNTTQYEGAAIFVVNGTVDIEGILQTLCLTGAPCTNQKFPDDHMVAILSSGDMSVGAGDPLNRPTGAKAGLDRVMALLYTEGSFFSAGASGVGSRNVIIGTVAARVFCFAKGCAGSGSSDETRLFQAGLRVFPDELLPGRNRWAIAPLQKFWRECVPLTVTPTYTFSSGRCPY